MNHIQLPLPSKSPVHNLITLLQAYCRNFHKQTKMDFIYHIITMLISLFCLLVLSGSIVKIRVLNIKKNLIETCKRNMFFQYLFF